jgi:hypothetical protein
MEENKDINIEEYIAKAEQIESIEFNEDDKFDFNDYFETITKVSNKNNYIKSQEADNLIKEYAPHFIDNEYTEILESKKQKVFNYLRYYDPNKEFVKNMSDNELDKIYAISNYLTNLYIGYLNNIDFKFSINKDEFKFLNRVLTSSIEYNADDVFNYVDFYDNVWKTATSEYNSDNMKKKNIDVIILKMKIKDVLILHHLIKGYKVKGGGEEFKYFRNILYTIAQINKLFNAFSITTERIKEDCKIWGGSLDNITTERKIAVTDTLEATAEVV